MGNWSDISDEESIYNIYEWRTRPIYIGFLIDNSLGHFNQLQGTSSVRSRLSPGGEALYFPQPNCLINPAACPGHAERIFIYNGWILSIQPSRGPKYLPRRIRRFVWVRARAYYAGVPRAGELVLIKNSESLLIDNCITLPRMRSPVVV